MGFFAFVKRRFLPALFMSLSSLGCIGYAEGISSPSYEQVMREAKEHNLPLLVAFLGEETCPWSQRIKKELLDSEAFLKAMKGEVVLWVVVASQEEQQAYAVEQLPCFLLLDPRGKEFARLDYGISDPKRFSARVLALVQDFHEVCVALDKGLSSCGEERLKELYLKAAQFSAPCFKQVILSQGLKKEKQTFFHLEKCQLLLEKCKLKHPQVVRLRQELWKRDPHNQWGTQRQFALLEFKKRVSTWKKGESLEKVMGPLVQYLEQFGKQDKEHAWKVEMALAEFLFSKQDIQQALHRAIRARDCAPDAVKPSLSKVITVMQSRLPEKSPSPPP